MVIDRIRAQGTGVDRVSSRMINPLDSTYTPLVSTRNRTNNAAATVTSESTSPSKELRTENATRPISSTAPATEARATVHGQERSTRARVNEGITHPG